MTDETPDYRALYLFHYERAERAEAEVERLRAVLKGDVQDGEV